MNMEKASSWVILFGAIAVGVALMFLVAPWVSKLLAAYLAWVG